MIDEHDKREIENLIRDKEFILWFRKLTKEEKDKWIIKRWHVTDAEACMKDLSCQR